MNDNLDRHDEMDSQDSTSVDFHFIKSNMFRVIHMDGAWGGITPQGQIQMAIFSERTAFPSRVRHEIDSGQLGAEIDREGHRGIEREIEVDVRMSLEKAISLRNWLSDRIQDLQSRIDPEAQD